MKKDNILFNLDSVSKYYNKRDSSGKKISFPVLENFSLHIHEGAVHALVGKSGCGKSTLTRIIMRLEGWDKGTITYRGIPLNDTPIKEFRQKNRIMFQSPLLSVNPSFTIEKIILEPLIIDGWSKKDATERLWELLALMELPVSTLKKFPDQLSTGQLQRVVLARTLSMEPEFLILDEPFSALDSELTKRIGSFLLSLIKRNQMTVLLIAHNHRNIELLSGQLHHMTEL